MNGFSDWLIILALVILISGGVQYTKHTRLRYRWVCPECARHRERFTVQANHMDDLEKVINTHQRKHHS